MGRREELINEIAEKTGTEDRMRNDGAMGKQIQRLSSPQVRAIYEQLTGSEPSWEKNRADIMRDICSELGYDPRKSMMSSSCSMPIDGLEQITQHL